MPSLGSSWRSSCPLLLGPLVSHRHKPKMKFRFVCWGAIECVTINTSLPVPMPSSFIWLFSSGCLALCFIVLLKAEVRRNVLIKKYCLFLVLNTYSCSPPPHSLRLSELLGTVTMTFLFIFSLSFHARHPQSFMLLALLHWVSPVWP